LIRAKRVPSAKALTELARSVNSSSVPEAIEALAIAGEFPGDRFMDYVRAEAARVLEPDYRQAREAGQRLAFTTRPGLEFLYGSMSTEELAAEPRSPEVYRAMLLRSGLDERLRSEAVDALAKADQTSVVKVVAGALAALDARQGEVDSTTVFDLIRLLLARPAGELAELRGDMEKLATAAKRPIMRRIGYVALMTIDAAGGTGGDACERAWTQASGKPERLVDLIEALPLVGDPAVAAGLYDRMLPLLDTPEGKAPARPGAPARYVRIELPGDRRTLTLAEVEVYADGKNVARGGKASQINTSNNGVAARAIDGNTSPVFTKGGQTHCQENSANPWWEVDLGREYEVERIVVYNRGEGNLGERLRDFSLIALAAGRTQTYRLDRQPAPSLAAEFALTSDADRTAVAVRRAVFDAIVGVKGKEAEAFRKIAPFIKDGTDRDAGIRAGRANWPTA